jgi:transcriptional regulator with XRE-family HTH domain
MVADDGSGTLAAMQTTFGALLREHRRGRGLSQESLSQKAAISTRHLSFMETGRAQPSREMTLTLASALSLPLREHNALLLAAGYAPAYRETPLGNPTMAEARRALELVLRRHEPFAAVAYDRHWDVVLANRPYSAVLRALVGDDAPEPYVVQPEGRLNAMRLLFHPDGIRRHLANWTEVARAFLPRLIQAQASTDLAMCALAREILSYPGVPRVSEPGPPPALLVPLVLRLGDVTLRLFTTLSTLGTAQDVTLAELCVESFHPADDATDRHVRGAAAK